VVLRIDPGIAQVWSSPTTLRFGAERPRLVLEGVDSHQEVLLHALTTGTTRPALHVLALQAGADSALVDELLEQLAPFLETESTPTPAAPLAVALERTLPWPADTAGLESTIARVVSATGAVLGGRDEAPGLAVVVGAHLVAPAVSTYWLSRDIPLLPVIMGEESLTVGPLVVPGETACLYCVGCHRTDEDAAWPMIASQLLDPAQVTPLRVDAVSAVEAAAIVARTIRASQRRESTGLEGAAVRIQPDGAVSRRAWAPHPRCSCRALRGNVTELVPRSDAVLPAPTTSAVSPALA
jgi:hypothetical protein